MGGTGNSGRTTGLCRALTFVPSTMTKPRCTLINYNKTNATFKQKQSPFLDDLNFLIDMSFGMDLSLERKYDDFLPLGNECRTWQDVRASHSTGDNHIVINLNETYGMLIILFVGLNGAMIIFAIEYMVHKLSFKGPQQLESWVK